MKRFLLVAMAATLLGTVPPHAVQPARAQGGPSAMIVGDSISQGLEGDYTWRYRLAQFFADTHTRMDFVGPWAGTTQLPATLPAGWRGVGAPVTKSGAYRPGVDFDSAHLARWGWTMREAKNVIGAHVSTYRPDFLFVELGFNDLGWSISSPDGLAEDVETFVANARAADPDISILLANVAQRTPLADEPDLPAKIAAYNELLTAAIPGLSTSASPVHLVDLDAHLDGTTDTYDGLHPNVRGDYAIATAFANMLFAHTLIGGIHGGVPATVPELLALGTPATITATPVGDAIRLSWSHVFGAAGYELFARDATTGEQFTRTQLPIPADSWTAGLLAAGHRYEFYVRAVRGTESAGGNSAVAQATAAHCPRGFTFPPDPDGWRPTQWNLGNRVGWTQDHPADVTCGWCRVAPTSCNS